MTSGIKSHTTKIGIGDGASPEVFSNLTEGYVVPAFGGTKGLIDFSNHDTVDMKDYQVQDLAEGDQMECEANYIPGNVNQGLFKTAYDNETEDNYRVLMRDGTTFVFAGRCLGWHVDPSELDGKVKIKFSVKVTGTITETNPA